MIQQQNRAFLIQRGSLLHSVRVDPRTDRFGSRFLNTQIYNLIISMFLEKSSGGSEMIVKKFRHVFGTLTGFGPGSPRQDEISSWEPAAPARKITFFGRSEKNTGSLWLFLIKKQTFT